MPSPPLSPGTCCSQDHDRSQLGWGHYDHCSVLCITDICLLLPNTHGMHVKKGKGVIGMLPKVTMADPIHSITYRALCLAPLPTVSRVHP